MNKENAKIIKEIAERAIKRDNASFTLEEQLKLGEIMGAELHDDWRAPRKQVDGSFEPRWKTLTNDMDKAFVNAIKTGKVIKPDNIRINEDGQVELDIANSNFNQLSPFWRQDNYMAGCSAVRSIITNWKGLNHPNPEVTDFVVVGVANAIHEAWISRGNVGDWNKDLETAYVFLSPSEKQKDLQHYKMALKLVKNLKKEMTKLNEQENGKGFE